MSVRSKCGKTPLKRNKPKRPKLVLKTSITSLDVVKWFIQENEQLLPQELVRVLHGALRARDIPALRRAAERYDVPQLYARPSDYAVVAQVFALLTKVPYPFGDGDAGRKRVALEKFHKTELLCRITSRKLDYYWAHPERENPVMRVLLTRARGLVDKVLGSVDNALPEIVDKARFGPGMTFCSVDSARTTPYYKFGAASWSVTPTARPYASLVVLGSPMWVSRAAEVDWATRTTTLRWTEVTSCRLTFVPKDERSYRTIAIEPFGNVLCQLGVHEYLTKRLRTHAGIDIRSQEWNQQGALSGSTDWLSWDSFSTIDLSSASDCVSPGLVRRLVRPQWVALLDDLRSKEFELDGERFSFSKWSSMGNGYTFALETLLFWALAQVCEEYVGTGQRALAYGDDILVSKRSALLVLEVLRYTGFRFNSAKTNVVGPFRESCGADFHTGVAVRPVYLKQFSLEVPKLFVLMNSFNGSAPFSTDLLWSKLLEGIPEDLRLFGPVTECMDGYIHAPWFWLHKTRPRGFRYDRDIQTHFHRRLVFQPKVFGGLDPLKYLCWLYGARGDRKIATGVEDDKPWGFTPAVTAPRRCSGPLSSEWFSPVQFQVTRRKRGSYRLRSTRCSFGGTTDRLFFYLA